MDIVRLDNYSKEYLVKKVATSKYKDKKIYIDELLSRGVDIKEEIKKYCNKIINKKVI